MRVLGFSLVFWLSFVVGCATSPTGRKQLMLMPESQMGALGTQSFQQMKSQTPVSQDPGWNQYVRCIVAPIARVAEKDMGRQDWEVVVFKEDQTVNAFALPGGKIGVYTGLLKVAQTDGQLAAVLGHEVGHVIARHGNERVSEQLATQGGLAALGALTQNVSQQGLLMGLLGVGAQVGVALPHSRTQESEADLIGLDLMSQAGFDPAESIALWKNMSQAAGGKAPPEWLSTHPANENRIQNLQAHLAQAEQKYQAAVRAGAAGHAGTAGTTCARPDAPQAGTPGS